MQSNTFLFAFFVHQWFVLTIHYIKTIEDSNYLENYLDSKAYLTPIWF